MQYIVTGYRRVAIDTWVEAETPEEALRVGRDIFQRGGGDLAGEETLLNDFDVDADDGEPLLVVIDGKLIT
jgi:hypothetical protein